MRTEDYKAMLDAVEKALSTCRESFGKMDGSHRKICEDLRDARDRLLQLLNPPRHSVAR